MNLRHAQQRAHVDSLSSLAPRTPREGARSEQGWACWRPGGACGTYTCHVNDKVLISEWTKFNHHRVIIEFITTIFQYSNLFIIMTLACPLAPSPLRLHSNYLPFILRSWLTHKSPPLLPEADAHSTGMQCTNMSRAGLPHPLLAFPDSALIGYNFLLV